MSSEPPTTQVLPTMAYAARRPQTVDDQHLSTLAVCHYIWGALLTLFACFGIVYIVMGVAIISGGFMPPTAAGATPPPFDDRAFGIIFIVMGAGVLLAGWTLAACTILAGRWIGRRRRRVFCIVIAAINCAMFPLGTVLGVFTLMVLLRDSVRQLYDQGAIGYPSSGSNVVT